MAPDESNIAMEAEDAETHSREESSEPTQSDSGSMTHPYRTQLEDTSFARCHLIATPSGRAETFSRSLYMLGNGNPLWQPTGNIPLKKGRPFKPSLTIGDVGFLDQEGRFEYYFNIFKPDSDSIQNICPPDMEPLLPPPEPADVQINPLHFPPGTTLTSKGVEVSQTSSSPLDISFTIKAREGAILVLPNGASREDLISTSRIRDYVQKNALKWYIFINEIGRGRIICPNGYLYLITGCDKSDTWATAVYPQSYERVGRVASVRYQANKREIWTKNRGMTCESREAMDPAEINTLFIRGMKIAVNIPDWTKYVLNNEPPQDIVFYNVLAVPVLGFRARFQSFLERRQNHPEKYSSESTDFIFHPLEIILRYLLEEFPTSDVAIVEDSVWAAVADSEADSDLSSITQLLIKILETCNTSNQGGWVILEPTMTGILKNTASNGPHGMLFGIPNLLKEKYRERLRRRYISRKISKIFPGSPVPVEQLRNDP